MNNQAKQFWVNYWSSVGKQQPIPQIGQHSIVLDSKDVPVAIIELTDVFISPMNEVPLEFALAEGEGDYEYWWNAHEQFFEEALQAYHLPFAEDMLLVCERFKVIHTAYSIDLFK